MQNMLPYTVDNSLTVSHNLRNLNSISDSDVQIFWFYMLHSHTADAGPPSRWLCPCGSSSPAVGHLVTAVKRLSVSEAALTTTSSHSSYSKEYTARPLTGLISCSFVSSDPRHVATSSVSHFHRECVRFSFCYVHQRIERQHTVTRACRLEAINWFLLFIMSLTFTEV